MDDGRCGCAPGASCASEGSRAAEGALARADRDLKEGHAGSGQGFRSQSESQNGGESEFQF